MKTCDFFLLFINIFSTCSALLINLGNVTIQHVCENQHLNLKCSNENETLQIIRSMYGRTSQRICNDDHLTSRIFHKTCANIEQSKAQSKLQYVNHRWFLFHWFSFCFCSCHGKSSCQIFIDNQIFTDPCGSTISKHFEIHYRCIDRGQWLFNDAQRFLLFLFLFRTNLSWFNRELFEVQRFEMSRENSSRFFVFMSIDDLSLQWERRKISFSSNDWIFVLILSRESSTNRFCWANVSWRESWWNSMERNADQSDWIRSLSEAMSR